MARYTLLKQTAAFYLLVALFNVCMSKEMCIVHVSFERKL